MKASRFRHRDTIISSLRALLPASNPLPFGESSGGIDDGEQKDLAVPPTEGPAEGVSHVILPCKREHDDVFTGVKMEDCSSAKRTKQEIDDSK